MKNIIVTTLLVAAMALTLASCGGDDKKPAETSGKAAGTVATTVAGSEVASEAASEAVTETAATTVAAE